MYTVNEEGLLNNYAAEPSVYYASYPSLYEQRQYVMQGAIGLLIVVTSVLTALVVS